MIWGDTSWIQQVEAKPDGGKKQNNEYKII